IRARGFVDNVIAEFPDRPVTQIAGAFRSDTWQVNFVSRTNWLYKLEASGDLRQWTAVTADAAGTGQALTLTDESAAKPPIASDRAEIIKEMRQRFYRVRAERL